jgi:hypothetical protein
MIHRWLGVSENKKEINALGGKDRSRAHPPGNPECMKRLHQLSEHVFGQFIRLFGIQK